MEASYERQPEEGAKAFAAFETYVGKGAKRSLAAVGQELGKSEGLIERWSRRYNWVERARKHDARMAAMERDAADAKLRAKSAEWLRRQEEVRDQEWAVGDDCIKAGVEALRRFHENSRKGATLGDVSQILKVGSQLRRLAAGMATDRTEVTGEGGGPVQVELMPALRRVFGEIVDASEALGQRSELEAGQMLLVPRGDCTDTPLLPAPAPVTETNKPTSTP